MDLYQSAVETAHQIRTRQVSPVEVTQAYLDRIDAVNDTINAVVWRNDEEVLAAARRAEEAVMAGGELPAFHGVPIPVKNLADVAGQPNNMNSLALDDEPRHQTDPAVARLQQAGFLLMGRTNSPEFGPLTVSENARYGATRNPWDPQRTSGGSSGGASAAVAAGMAPLAHASDGGGSIRVPSSCTGLVGLKPSRGRVPQSVVGWEHSTVEGVITRTVTDAAAVLDVMAGPDAQAWYSAPAPTRSYASSAGEPPSRLRIGLMLTAPTGMPVDSECVEAAQKAAAALAGAGHEIVDVSPVLFSRETIAAFQVIISSWVSANTVKDESLLDPYIRYRYEQGRSLSAGQYAQASAMMQLETRQIVKQWGGDFDVLLTPTMATVTPPVGLVYDEANNDPSGVRQTEIQMVSFTSFANMTGQPAISLPVHTASDGMPVGAQLVGAPFQDDVLLQLGAQLERSFRWDERRAPEPAVTVSAR
ncbi:amidase [Cellulosimicrobium funkei]|nr:amidase [Cellulosimicrobium funkei]